MWNHGYRALVEYVTILSKQPGAWNRDLRARISTDFNRNAPDNPCIAFISNAYTATAFLHIHYHAELNKYLYSNPNNEEPAESALTYYDLKLGNKKQYRFDYNIVNCFLLNNSEVCLIRSNPHTPGTYTLSVWNLLSGKQRIITEVKSAYIYDVSPDGKVLLNTGYADIFHNRFVEFPEKSLMRAKDSGFNRFFVNNGKAVCFVHFLSLYVYDLKTKQEYTIVDLFNPGKNGNEAGQLYIWGTLNNTAEILYGISSIDNNEAWIYTYSLIEQKNIKPAFEGIKYKNIYHSNNWDGCPQLFVREYDGYTHAGHLIPAFSSEDKAGTYSTVIQPGALIDNQITIRIAELMREITFIDCVVLKSGDKVHYPTSVRAELEKTDKNYLKLFGIFCKLNHSFRYTSSPRKAFASTA